MANESTATRVAMGQVVARLAKQLEAVLAEIELTPSQYRVLGWLALGPTGASGLAVNVAISKPSLTGVVDGLVTRGLVERHDDPNDRRRVALVLMPPGSLLLARADSLTQARLQEISACLEEQDALLALQALETWHEALELDRARRGKRARQG